MKVFQLGIDLIDTADANIQAFGQRFGFMPLSWRQVVMNNKSRDGLMWRIPDPAVPMATSLKSVQAILVAEYEKVIVLRDGRLGEQVVLHPGLYDIRRTIQLRGQIEVIWFTTREIQLRWGVADVLTKDRVTIGASGFYSAAITEPERFLYNLAGNEQVYQESQLLNFARPLASTIIRNMMASMSVMEFQQAQPEFQFACQEALRLRFAEWGLEFRGMTVETQSIPEEFRQAAQRRTIIMMDKEAELEGTQADVKLAQLRAEKERYTIALEAERIRQLGNARVDVMQGQLGIGLNPMELKRIEAIETLAEHPAEGTLVDNRPQIVSNLLPPPPTIPPPSPIIVTGTPILAPAESSSLPPSVLSSASPSTSEPMTREKIQEMLDKFDEQFANGEMSEQTYLMLQDKWQKRLAKLP